MVAGVPSWEAPRLQAGVRENWHFSTKDAKPALTVQQERAAAPLSSKCESLFLLVQSGKTGSQVSNRQNWAVDFLLLGAGAAPRPGKNPSPPCSLRPSHQLPFPAQVLLEFHQPTRRWEEDDDEEAELLWLY